MEKELKIISPDALTDIGAGEVRELNELIEEMVKSSNSNMEDICELTLECSTMLSSADSRTTALENQKMLQRLWGGVSGKNKKLQNAIMRDQTNALYAAQETINCVMRECAGNRELILAVNERMNALHIEAMKNDEKIADAVRETRGALVEFYKQYQESISEGNEKITSMENYEKATCPNCNAKLLSWQRVCPHCGEIHSLKIEKNSDEVKKVLAQISEIVKNDELLEDIVWDVTAQKTEKTLRKVKALAEKGKIPGYTEELDKDIYTLINKCMDAEFQIAVVGVMKAGKSFLMNALIGAEVASVEVNPETAALTKFRSANGYYVLIKFHNKKQWEMLKKSAENSGNAGADSLEARLNHPKTVQMEAEWIEHEDLRIECKTLKELQEKIKQYTSSQAIEHLFVSEVEVGIDKSVFNMPNEVVFVDTPGLKDPVKYRSDITKNYIKEANAVLVAVKPGPFTAEGIEVITTVLDYTDSEKAYIVGTQKDLNSEEEREKYVDNWEEHLVQAKRYKNKRAVDARIVLTTSKMSLLLNKWMQLSEKEKNDETYFSIEDYETLESFAARVLKKRGFTLMQISSKECSVIEDATGIPTLKENLERTLIANYRRLKAMDIAQTFCRCKERIAEVCREAITQQEEKIKLAESGAEALQKKINDTLEESKILKKNNADLKREAEKLENLIQEKIQIL